MYRPWNNTLKVLYKHINLYHELITKVDQLPQLNDKCFAEAWVSKISKCLKMSTHDAYEQ